MFIYVFCPFFDWVVCFLVLSCMSYLCILEINPLSVASFASIFSHFEDCLFVLFMVSFAVHKRLSLIRSHLFVFVFIFITLGGGSNKIFLRFMSKTAKCMFCSEMSGLTFRSLIYFQFIFVLIIFACKTLSPRTSAMILGIHSFNKYVSNGENMPGSTLHSAFGIQGLLQNTAPPLPLNLLEVTGYSQVENRAWKSICISLMVIFLHLPALQQHWPLLVPWRCRVLWCPRALACAVPSTQNTLPLPSPLPIFFFPHLCPGNSYTWNLSLGITSLEATHLLVIFPGHVIILIAPVSLMECLLVGSMTRGAVSWGQCLCCSHQSPASGIMLDKGQGLHEHLLNEWIVNRIWCIAFQSNAEPNQGVSPGRRQEVAICPSYFLVLQLPLGPPPSAAGLQP